MMGLVPRLRQLWFPKEFRIGAPGPLLPDLAKIMDLSKHLKQERLPDAQATDESRLAFMAQLATGVWRLRNKMTDRDSGYPLEGMRKAFRHLESVWDVISQAGIDIQDHTGADYDSGMSLNVIAFQPESGLMKEIVIETIKPSVYLKNRRIQIGEVIVGRPLREGSVS
jgi:hypothetical protein